LSLPIINKQQASSKFLQCRRQHDEVTKNNSCVMYYSQALNVLAMTLSLPPDALPLSKSFFDLGGNSISMVAAIVELRQHSLYIGIDQFSRASSIREIIDHVTVEVPTSSAAGSLSPVDYEFVSLCDVGSQGDRLVNMWAECAHSDENRLYTLLGITKGDAILAAHDIYEAAKKVCTNTTFNGRNRHVSLIQQPIYSTYLDCTIA
jgi:Phosphopantetheine attachment site